MFLKKKITESNEENKLKFKKKNLENVTKNFS